MKHFTFSLKMLLFSLFVVGGVNSAWAEVKTGTITFGSATGSTSINASSVTGDDNLGNTWTITTDGTTSYTPNANFAQVGSSKAPATSITFTTTLSSEVQISSVSAEFGGFSGTAGTVTLKVGDTKVGDGALNASNDVTVSSTSSATGNVLTVTVTSIAKGVKCYYVSYSYDDSGKQIPELSFTPNEKTVYINETSYEKPKFTCNSTGSVTYSSTDESVATVDNNGNVTLKGVGTTTIKASVAATDTYIAGFTSYTLIVKDIPSTYKKVTSSDELVLGGKFLIVYEDNEEPKALGAISTTSTKYGLPVDVTINGAYISIEDEAVNVLTLENGNSEGYYAFKESLEDKYLAWTSGNSLSSNSGDSNPSSWAIGYDDSGIVTITNKSSDDTRVLKYNTGSPRFACYTSGQEDLALYRRVVSATISDAGYATYCSNQPVSFIGTGVTAYIVSAVDENSVTLMPIESVPANTPVVVKAAEGTYYLPVIASATAPATNYLKVSDGTVTGDGSTIYALANKGGVGFFLVDDGLAIPAGKCYLDGTASAAKARLGFSFEGEDATAITAIEATEAVNNGVIYNLNGQRVVKPLKGIYIQNGKKILVK